uniref:Transposase n=1 Tax=Mesocestoides corti TaxID=53468 RepID=A0A5K3G386_MESCO
MCRIPERWNKENWHKRTGFIEQSQAKTTSQEPSTRVHHAGHEVLYILLRIRACLWLAAWTRQRH